ncbi:MAG: type II toxin-antitoxin system RelB/DinJ family antitoxin [Nitrococcus sp.]|nr:type II toxin-antitoxin system RelB/DinJ family antitoxin [Nitrococcus sp.]
MSGKAVVRARISEDIKNEAANVLEQMGLTVSDVVRITLTRIAHEKALPFELRVPNKLTEETLTKSERGQDLHHADDAQEMFRDLDI